MKQFWRLNLVIRIVFDRPIVGGLPVCVLVSRLGRFFFNSGFNSDPAPTSKSEAGSKSELSDMISSVSGRNSLNFISDDSIENDAL